MSTLDIYKEVTTLYNGEAKLHFLEDINLEESTKKILFFTLKRINNSLLEFNKDVYELNADELEELLYNCQFKTKTSASAAYSNIMLYCRWASLNGYIDSYLPKFTDSSFSERVEKYVSKTISQYYTQEDLFEMYKEFINPQDTLIMQATFEGIRGKANSELINLNTNDMYEKDGKYYINLYDTEKGIDRPAHEISKYLYDLIIYVDGLTSITDAREVEMHLTPSKYVLKRSSRGKGNPDEENAENPKVTSAFILNRSHLYKKIFNNNNFRLKDVEKSGVMHYLNTILTEKNSNEVGSEEYSKISDKFDVGKFVHSTNGEIFINYNTIKNLIDETWYEKTYNNIELS